MSKPAMFLAPEVIHDSSDFIYYSQYIHVRHLIHPAHSLHPLLRAHFKGSSCPTNGNVKVSAVITITYIHANTNSAELAGSDVLMQ